MSTVCGACGDVWQDGMSCGQKDNGHPFPTCYPHMVLDPELAAMQEALQMVAGALQCVAKLLPEREQHVVNFTGDWSRFGSLTLTAILDRANLALEPERVTEADHA